MINAWKIIQTKICWSFVKLWTDVVLQLRIYLMTPSRSNGKRVKYELVFFGRCGNVYIMSHTGYVMSYTMNFSKKTIKLLPVCSDFTSQNKYHRSRWNHNSLHRIQSKIKYCFASSDFFYLMFCSITMHYPKYISIAKTTNDRKQKLNLLSTW